MVRAAQGDHSAFTELATRVIGQLTAAARMILQDEYAAQDAVQDTLIEVWRSLPGLRDPDRFDAWLRKVLVRACFSRVRSRRARSAMEIRLTPADEPSSRGGERELAIHDQLERALARIPKEQRAVIALVYYFDLPLAEAAHALGIPLGTTKSRLSRATQSLRAAIEADEREAAPAAGGLA